MISSMRDRIAIYRMNTGTGWALWNLFLLGFVVWLVVRTGDPLVRILAGVVLACALVTGWIIIPITQFSTRLANNLIQSAKWIAVAVIVVGWTNTVRIPPLVHLGVLALLMWSMAASFWFISTPGILTATGVRTLHKRAERAGAERNPFLP